MHGHDQTLVSMTLFRLQVQEPVLLLGPEKFAGVDIRVRVKGGGHVAQIYGEGWVIHDFKSVLDS